MAFVARDHRTGTPQLWVRRLDSTELRSLPGTEHAFRPFWSPDSRSLAFFASGKLRRIGLNDEGPQTLAHVGYLPSGGTWSNADVIVYADRQSPLYAVAATGGTPHAITSLDKPHGEVAHQAPFFLPDGRHFLFLVASTSATVHGTYVGSLDTPDRIRLLDDSASAAIYAPPGYVLFVRDGAIMAQRIDLPRLRMTGATTIVTTTRSVPGAERGVATMSASLNNLLTFGGDTPDARLVWFRRDGTRLDEVNAPAALHNPTLSPDQRFVAAADGSSLWLVDLERKAPTRFATGNIPIWGPDGTRLAFTMQLGDSAELATRSITGPATGDGTLFRNTEMKIAGSWTRSGDLVYTASNPETRLDLWVLPTAGASKPYPYLRTASNEMHPQVSPDGRYIAYASDESGEWQVYVQTFPVPGGKRTISIKGGAEPMWRRDGRELYFLAPDGTIMSVEVRPDGESIDVGAPRPLFQTSIAGDIITYRNHYAVTADGQRFLVDSAGTREPITVVVNWNAPINF